MARFGMRAAPAALLLLAVVPAVASVPLSIGNEAVYDTVAYPLNAVGLALAGALVASHQRGNPLGRLMLGMGVVAAWVELAESWGNHPGWPAVAVVEWVGNWANQIGIGCTALLLVLFPTGRDLGRGRRLLLAAGVLATALLTVGAAFGHSSAPLYRSGRNPYAVDGLETANLVGQLLFSATLVLAIVALVARFVRARDVERQQLKWVTFVVALLAVVGPFAIFLYNDSALVRIAIAVVVTALPAAICVAILRYRLYDIDVIVNRTVVYGALTVLLAAAYLGTAFVLGALAGGGGSSWVTAGATLAAATAFRPLRSRIQREVDRRFRPARHEAFTRVDAFLADLHAGRVVPEELETVLREATARPDLTLGYVLPGDPVPDTGSSEGRTVRVVERAGTPLAVLTHDDAEPDVARLVEDVVERAGLAVEIGRLRAEVGRRLAEVEASRARIVAAGYEERRRLERDLHDGAQQRLVSVGLALRHLQFALGDSELARSVDGPVAELTAAITELRELARGVRPAYLDDGLDVALRDLARRTPLPVTVRVGTGRFAGDVEATAYFVASEALTNAVKHARAGGVDIATRVDGDRLVLTVRDDGVGGAAPSRGSGLRGLSDRVAAQGGRLRVESPRGRGTTLTVELPCRS